MAERGLPLKLPAAVFSQVEGLEDLLQSHHLDDGKSLGFWVFFFNEKPSALLHGAL